MKFKLKSHEKSARKQIVQAIPLTPTGIQQPVRALFYLDSNAIFLLMLSIDLWFVFCACVFFLLLIRSF